MVGDWSSRPYQREVADGNFLGQTEAGAEQNPVYGDVVTRSQDTTAAIVQASPSTVSDRPQ